MIKTYQDSIKPFAIRLKTYKNIKFNTLSIYDNRYIKTKIRTYGDKVHTNFCGLNVRDDDIKWESFTIVSIDSLPVYKNK